MLYANKPVPLYRQLYRKLRDRIEDGDFQPGKQLPSERQIAAEYGVSRLTARKAFGILAREGYIRAYQGKGSFVVSPKGQNLCVLTPSLDKGPLQQRAKPSRHLIKTDVVATDTDLAEQLQLSPGDQVVRIQWLHLADGCPVALETNYLPYTQCSEVLKADLQRSPFLEVLKRDLGIQIQCPQVIVEAVLASEDELKLLNLEPPAALLLLQRTTYDDKDQIVEYSRVFYRQGWYRIEICPQWL